MKRQDFRRGVFLALALAALTAVLAGCTGGESQGRTENRAGDEVVASYSQTLPTTGVDELRLTQGFGSIDIVGTADESVSVEVTKKAKGPDRDAVTSFLDGLQADLVVQGNRATVFTKGMTPPNGVRLTGLSYVLRVPKTRRLRIDLTGTNTTLGVADIQGSVWAKLNGGGASLKRFTGDVTVSADNAKIDIADSTGDLDITNINGPVVLDDVGLANKARVATSNASLNLRFKSVGVGRYEFQTTNAPVELYLPYGAAVRIQTATTVGRVRDQLPLTWVDINRMDDQNVWHLDGWLNAGGAQMIVATTNSDITLAYR